MITQDKYTFNRLVLASYRLPFNLIKKDDETKIVQNSGGLVSAILSLSQKMDANFKQNFAKKIVWVGYSEYTKQEFTEFDSDQNSFDVYPVNIEPKIHRKYYNGFCNDMIWPLFHYFPSLAIMDESYFDNYVKANQLFFKEMEKFVKPDDLIWIHDYQLFLLPKLIRDSFPKANIGFFLHIPFPSYEIFRMIQPKWREEILRGILGADLIGFHTNDYTQHFLNTVSRILGYENTLREILTEDNIIKADAFPIGIDYDKFSDAAESFEVEKEVNKLKEAVGEKKLIFSVDRLDYTKGILNRLLGLEYFLEKYPVWRSRVIFNMVVVPSRDAIPRYQEMKKEIEANVGRINGKYSTIDWRPIIYQYKSLSFNELVALYSFSHVGLITPLRDGMNLVAKEYVASQRHNIGVLILSEMAGAVAELGGAIIINPFDKKEMGEAIYKALQMDDNERNQRILQMKNRLKSYNVFSWTNDFLNQLQLIKDEQKIMEIKYINSDIEEEVLNNYKNANSRVIFLDYDGTLVPFAKYPELATPSMDVIEQLKILSSDNKNSIVIISGREQTFLEKWFGDMNIYIIAEHGALIKRPNEKWEYELYIDVSWKDKISPIFQKYSDRCNGSFVEEKNASLAWHFRNADADFAFVRSQELKEELKEIMSNELQILEGNKVIEVKKKGYDKGFSAKKFIDNKKDVDFILAIGDDKTDEDLFKAMPSNSYTIKVGASPSNAKYNLRYQNEVLALIDKLIE
ncbi:MAG: bifunctional alpha,alpha-trehalose-phosphate synthase (UDP-forming)/trehalose-phosphatase [Desulfobacterales bacterium]|nr:bifunctional alpha,alpha-trehalose-phosphate synthase (UDP-forming)/trehalose-phosphatase [Desulfobacterales bacterium]MBF0398664.1 bifunctional alpha,alpha-trehalose-phosphate synthase (UDP-forming)/trehalose-phosphatase [Desulfobacterales bacterium]